MDKDTRNAIERATQWARKLLEDDFAAQLEGDFDVHRDGALAAKAGSHLSARQSLQRERIVAAIEHKRGAGMSAADSVQDYLRDAAFTSLNRFAALKMLEARELVQECITKGEQSAGYREFCGMAPGLPLLSDSAGYRHYIESLFDELSTEVKVLFDRRDPSSALWPKRATFEQLLEILNASELAMVWGEDETIGWVYQFFNDPEERRKMRDPKQGGSQTPRNSRELAVRNQFFTPRYVVQFLTDNTLGRIWYEMRGTETVLVDRCEYMVRKRGEELAPRTKKDPRDLRVLDPACGSGHFLLYAFDLLLTIYEEAYADPESPRSEATRKALAEDYPSLDALRKAVPSLVLAHNLHGVDIDPRCAQIAQLALWMRAQKAYRDFGIGRAERAQVRRSNVVVAEPLVADELIAREFVAKLGDPELGRVFMALVESLKLAGDLGLLLRIEQLVSSGPARGKTGDLFAPPEERIRASLARFTSDEGGRASTRRRLFADDAAHGIALLGVAERRFDVVLMNPPFGEPSDTSRQTHKTLCPDSADNLAVSFVSRGMELLASRGVLGAITDRSWQTKFDYTDFRRRLLGANAIRQVVDLGWGVLDANVETSLGVFGDGMGFVGWRSPSDERADTLKDWTRSAPTCAFTCADFANMPNAILAYDMPPEEYAPYARQEYVPNTALRAVAGIKSCDSAADFRLWWEVCSTYDQMLKFDASWLPLHNGSPYCPFHFPSPFAVRARDSFGELLARGGALPGAKYYDIGGAAYGKRTDRMYAYHRKAGEVFSQEGQALFPTQNASVWDVVALSNSSLFARHANYVSGQHKYHNYINLIALSQTRNERAALAAERAFTTLSELDTSNELAVGFRHPGACEEFSIENSSEQRTKLAAARIDSVRALHDEINAVFAVTENDRMPARAVDYYEIYFGSSFSDSLVHALWASWAVGRAFGRWQAGSAHTVLADDLGTVDDIVGAIALPTEHFHPDELRDYLRNEFFQDHLTRYSRSRRKAPIYWQLATPSANYSVWLYIHAFSKDTLFRVQNDYVAPKLAHEERRLESLSSELRDGATAAQRKAMAAQESVVEELRAFLDEVRRIAPLWNPNLDDGVIINFAPLWRLVPQNKSWQKELKSTWDALCDRKYDWAHLAMHLWPEHVVPKCAKDRSLAIAHGLEDAFWVEGDNGKWTARKTPKRSIDELVRERTSPAVKSALNSLLEAPSANGATRKTKKGKA